ncbi:MAG TPA: glycosyltransferase family 2 protein [Actinomycetota bacterium]|nr:glycosyltransferase family 2 protein [Actinomycetota bacterium]
MSAAAPVVSVIMPTFRQAELLPRAVASLMRQTLSAWTLTIVDDGSPDETAAVAARFLRDPRVRYVRLRENQGLGAAANTGLRHATAPFVAYLPSDDVYDPEHLASLLEAAGSRPAAMAVSGVRYGGRSSLGAPEGFPLQLAQVLHRRTADRWIERRVLESDDLDRLFWSRLARRGPVVRTGRVTCEWSQHAGQRTRAIRESLDGGLNTFRARYGVRTPLRFHSSDGWPVDEEALYARFRSRPPPTGAGGLRILLVGELGFHPERILAFEELGHRLFGLWIDDPLGPQTVGPLPFAHVADLRRRAWRDDVRRIRPDVIYALLGWRAVPLVHEVVTANTGIPVVWHFKEAPQRCAARGTWGMLAEIESRADAVVHASALEREWIEAAIPGACRAPGRSLVLDGELVKREWLDGRPARRLSQEDGEVHTVVLGRPLGLDPEVVGALGEAGVHLHLHGLVRAPGPGGEWRSWLGRARRASPGRVHVHPHVDQRGWVRDLSRYDAAWLHRFRSENGGDLAAATWDDLNLPGRIPALVAAGLPLLQRETPGALVATQDLVRERGIGLLYRDTDDLCATLGDPGALEAARRATWAQREDFTFDAHAPRLVDLFRSVAR